MSVLGVDLQEATDSQPGLMSKADHVILSTTPSRIGTCENNISALQSEKADISTVTGLQTAVAGKQDKLTAGTNITISGNTISAGGGVEKNAVTFNSFSTYITLPARDSLSTTRMSQWGSSSKSPPVPGTTTTSTSKLIYSFADSKFIQNSMKSISGGSSSSLAYSSSDCVCDLKENSINLVELINTWLQTLVGKKVVTLNGNSIQLTKPTHLQIAIKQISAQSTATSYPNVTLRYGASHPFTVDITVDKNGTIQTVGNFSTHMYVFFNGVSGNIYLSWSSQSLKVEAIPNGSASFTTTGIEIATN